MKYMITGATGHLGRLVMEALLEKVDPKEVGISVRSVDKAKDYADKGVTVRKGDFDDPQLLEETFAGVEHLLIISTDGDNDTRIKQHGNAIAAAKKAGVAHVVYTSLGDAQNSSLFLAPVHQASEDAIKASGMAYTLLRNNWYLENEVSSVQGVLAGAPWVTSAEEGKVGWVPRRDYALAAATVLVEGEKHYNKTYELSGVPHTQAELAQAVAGVIDKPVEVLKVDDAGYEKIMLDAGVPEAIMPMLLAIQAGIRDNQLAITSNDFEAVIGRKPTPIEEAVKDLVEAAKQ